MNMKRNLLHLMCILILASLLAGCGNEPLSTPGDINTQAAMSPTEVVSTNTTTAELSVDPSATPDPCSSGQIEAEVQKVHRHMREFDDASILASNLPREQLTDPIAGLQKIRREAEDEQVPACLTSLKKYQVDHMNSVINTLLAFMSGTDPKTLEKGVSVARQQHDQYTLELARLLGLTIVPATVPVISTPNATGTP
jgi:hypothetical protein